MNSSKQKEKDKPVKVYVLYHYSISDDELEINGVFSSLVDVKKAKNVMEKRMSWKYWKYEEFELGALKK